MKHIKEFNEFINEKVKVTIEKINDITYSIKVDRDGIISSHTYRTEEEANKVKDKIEKAAKIGKIKNTTDVSKILMESIERDNLLNESKLKADKKTLAELSQAVDKAKTVEDIWNQLDPKMFNVSLNDFEDIFNDWFDDNNSYDNVLDLAKNATTADVKDLLDHLIKKVK